MIKVVKGATLHGPTDPHEVTSQGLEDTSVVEDMLKSLSASARAANLDKSSIRSFKQSIAHLCSIDCKSYMPRRHTGLHGEWHQLVSVDKLYMALMK